MSRPAVILGAGGHAAVLLETLRLQQASLLGFAAPQPGDRLQGLDYLGDDAALRANHPPDSVTLINGLGSTGAIDHRARLYEEFVAAGYRFAPVIHPTAWLSPSASHGDGLQILAGAVVNTGVVLGKNVLINSRAVVEHHGHVGDHSHVASGAVVCGDCHIGRRVHIGAGAVINQGIRIGDGTVVASGAVVIADVAAGQLVAGVPAQAKKREEKHE